MAVTRAVDAIGGHNNITNGNKISELSAYSQVYGLFLDFLLLGNLGQLGTKHTLKLADKLGIGHGTATLVVVNNCLFDTHLLC